MADSNITKRALASALKDLMQEKAFEKISVGDICEKCDMNRKSFYYHFKDKYDLVNWIFDTEGLSVMKNRTEENTWEWYTQFLCGCHCFSISEMDDRGWGYDSRGICPQYQRMSSIYGYTI